MGSANDFAATLGIDSVEQALAAWKRFCETRENSRLIDLGTIQPLHPYEAAEMLPALRRTTMPTNRGEGESLETLHFVPDGPRRDLAAAWVRASNNRRRAGGSRPSAKRRGRLTSPASREPGWMQPSTG